MACFFFLSLALGSLFFVLVQFATRSGWSVLPRRFAEHVMTTVPVLGLLLVPLTGVVGSLYPWARGEAPQTALPAWHEAYFHPGFFYARAVTYLVVWTVLAWWFRRLSLGQDETRDATITRRLQTASAPALVLYAIFLGALGLLLRRGALIPIGDPRLAESLAMEHT